MIFGTSVCRQRSKYFLLAGNGMHHVIFGWDVCASWAQMPNQEMNVAKDEGIRQHCSPPSMYMPGFVPHTPPPPQILMTLISRPSYDSPMPSVETVSGKVSGSDR